MLKLFELPMVGGDLVVAKTKTDACRQFLGKTPSKHQVKYTKQINPHTRIPSLERLIKEREDTLAMKMRELVELKQKKEKIQDLVFDEIIAENSKKA